MKNLIKKLTLVLMIVALLSGCIPAEYKEGVKIDKGYPDKELPVYDDAIVFFCEEDSGEITLKAGSEDDVEDVIDFYQELFEDEDVFIVLKEKAKDDRYSAEGIIIDEELTFEIDIKMAKGKVEEKLFESEFEIVIAPQDEDSKADNVQTDTPKDSLTDPLDVAIDKQYPVDAFSKYPGTRAIEANPR